MNLSIYCKTDNRERGKMRQKLKMWGTIKCKWRTFINSLTFFFPVSFNNKFYVAMGPGTMA